MYIIHVQYIFIILYAQYTQAKLFASIQKWRRGVVRVDIHQCRMRLTVSPVSAQIYVYLVCTYLFILMYASKDTANLFKVVVYISDTERTHALVVHTLYLLYIKPIQPFFHSFSYLLVVRTMYSRSAYCDAAAAGSHGACTRKTPPPGAPRSVASLPRPSPRPPAATGSNTDASPPAHTAHGIC
jgi:hypothetical protein